MFNSQRENRRKRWYSLLSIGHKKLLVLAGFVVTLLLAATAVVGYYSFRALEFDLDRVVSGTGESRLYDASTPAREIGSLSNTGKNYTGWDELPDKLVNAFIAREDEHFFEHSGIVYSSILRSVLCNIMSMRYEQGASTITMQLTRNVFELRDKSLDRKMLEAVLAQRLEKRYNKATIFTQYINRIYFGENCYGITRAARHYFGKEVGELNLVECATLAGLVRAPSLCNPCHSMENAMGVKRETLTRMLEMDFISQEEYDAAVQAPITLAPHESAENAGGSYAILWANHELQDLQEELGENAGGISVVSNLNLRVQQYAEKAMEQALTAVERPNLFPEEWVAQLNVAPEEIERLKKLFTTAKRPAALKVRMQDNNLEGLLQCCVLVVDARRNRKGRVLAVIGGRSAADGIDRWQGKLRPGRAAAPLVFCCACLPGEDGHHIVARSAEVTGKRIGYDVVRAFMEGLKLDIDLPARESESELYNGLFDMKRIDLARLLFILNNQGRGYRLSLVDVIWSRGNVPLYQYEPEKAPEYIRRESALTVSKLAPFVLTEGKPTVLSETLPGHTGQFTMVGNENGVYTFVWMGLDDPASPAAASPELRRLLAQASLYLARDIHSKTRELLREAAKEKKEHDARQEQQKKPQPQAAA